MSEKVSGNVLARTGERSLRFLRDINAVTAVGFAAVGALAPPLALVAYPLAAWNGAQAGGYEIGRRMIERKTGAKSRTEIFSRKAGGGAIRAALS